MVLFPGRKWCYCPQSNFVCILLSSLCINFKDLLEGNLSFWQTKGYHSRTEKVIESESELDLAVIVPVLVVGDLFNANSAIFRLNHGENMLIFNEMMMRSALY